MCDDDLEDDDVGYESGPFCQHWGDPADCDEVCVCGHLCCQHDHWDDDHECNICDCKGFTQEE